MARSNAEHEASSPEPTHEPSPDSSELRVSRNTKHESGIPPAREGRTRDNLTTEAAQRLEHTLSEITRTEANLQSLVRGLKHLTAGANAALESAGPLASEVDAIRELLSRSSKTETALRQRVLELSKALERSEADARREHQNLIEQDDLFLIELVNDHERRVQELEQHVAELLGQRGGADVAELIAQRDQARAYALRCELERDLAWQDLGVKTPAPRVNASYPPPSEPGRAATVGQMKFRVTTPATERQETHPLEQTPTPPGAAVSPKPAAVTRRSAEYSMVGGEPAEEAPVTRRFWGR